MSDIQAAVGLQQLQKLPAFHRRRREIADRYTAAFSDFAELQTPSPSADMEHAWHIYALRLNLGRFRMSRDAFVKEMKKRQVGVSVHFIPVHLFSYYSEKYGYLPKDFPVAYAEYERLVSLPLSPRMSDSDVDDVIDAVISIIQGRSRSRSAAAGAGASSQAFQ